MTGIVPISLAGRAQGAQGGKIVAGLASLAVLLAPLPALAHAGPAHADGFAAGFLHPLMGLDHVVAMLAVGLWAGLTGGQARWLLPAGFLGGMALGGALGMAGFGLPAVEAGILASVIVLGALVATAVRLPASVGLMMVGAFGLLHGHAHGTEIAAGADAVGYSAGFLLATTLLHGVGLLAARRAADRGGWLPLRLASGAASVLAFASLTFG